MTRLEYLVVLLQCSELQACLVVLALQQRIVVMEFTEFVVRFEQRFLAELLQLFEERLLFDFVLLVFQALGLDGLFENYVVSTKLSKTI